MSIDRTARPSSLAPSPSTWPKRPKRGRHPTLGARQTWMRSDGLAMVQRFPEGDGRFAGFVRSVEDGDFRPFYGYGYGKLHAAQRACDRLEAAKVDGG